MLLKNNGKLFKAAIGLYIVSGIVYAQFGQQYERIFFVVSILAAVLSMRYIGFRKLTVLDFMDIFYAFFISTFLIDTVLYRALNPFVYGLAMLIMYVMIRVGMTENYTEKYYDINYRLAIFFSIVIYVLSYYKAGIYTHNYSGSMENSNTLGIFAASIGTVLISVIADNLVNFRRTTLYICILYGISVFITIISGCRIAMIADAVQIGILLIVRKKKRGIPVRVVRRIFAVAGLVLAVIIISLATGRTSLVYSEFIYKTIELAQRGNITNYRLEWWKATWVNAGLFGSGQRVYEQTVHNIYFGLINTYGKLNGIFFFLFTCSVLVRSLKFRYKECCSRWKYLPVMSCILFFMVSMTENYLMTYPMVLMYISIPIMCKFDKTGNHFKELPENLI